MVRGQVRWAPPRESLQSPGEGDLWEWGNVSFCPTECLLEALLGLPLENRGVWGGRFSKSISDSQTWEACSSVGNRTSVSLDSSQESRLAGEPQGEEQHVFWHRPPVNEMRRSYMSFHFLVGLVASHHREGPGELEPADQATYIFKCSIFSRFFQYSPVFFFPFHVVPGVIA